jgi:hypothetical protein
MQKSKKQGPRACAYNFYFYSLDDDEYEELDETSRFILTKVHHKCLFLTALG